MEECIESLTAAREWSLFSLDVTTQSLTSVYHDVGYL